MSSNASTFAIKDEDKLAFSSFIPTVIDSLVKCPPFGTTPEAASWFKQLLEYNLAGGKKLRGLTMILAYQAFEKPEKLNENSLRYARILACCVEMLQAHLCLLDDLIDGSITRRGRLCWYRMPDVGVTVLNDAELIFSAIYHTLDTYLAEIPQYADIVNAFNKTILVSSTGQFFDIDSSFVRGSNQKDKLNRFNAEHYQLIIKNKTAYYGYCLPVTLAMLLANIRDKSMYRKIEELCLDIGAYFQSQDDFIDCFSDESVTGKVGTDIQDGKCSWLAVQALQLCNSKQREIFEQFYGSKDPQHNKIIKQLYGELELSKLFTEWEKEHYNALVCRAKVLSKDIGLPERFFIAMIDVLFHRKC